MEFLDITIEPLDLVSLLVASFCGFAIGFERQWKGKTAGIRTSMLICLSASVFTAIGNHYQPEAGTVRIIGQIVTGVGFLGAGVIIARNGLIQGVTSAAVIWIVAAIGGLAGLKHHIAAIALTLLSVIILVIISYLENVMVKLKSGVHGESSEKNEINKL